MPLTGIPKAGQTQRFSTIRARMALLLLGVLILPAAYAVLHAIDVHHKREQQLIRSLNLTAALIAEHQQEKLQSVGQWLTQLAEMNPQRKPVAECNDLLGAEAGKSGIIRNLAVIDRTGTIACAGDPANIGLDVSDRLYFQEAMAGQALTVSRRLRSRRDNEIQGIIVVVPAHPDGVEVPEALVAAVLDLEVFTGSWSNLDLPAGAQAFLVDEAGQRIPPPPPTQDPNEVFPDLPLKRLLGGEIPFIELEDEDGTMPRILASAQVGTSGMRALVSLPSPRNVWLDPEVYTPAAIAALMLVIALMAIWLGTNVIVIRHVDALSRAVRGHQHGRLDLGSIGQGAPVELRDLGARFSRLTERVETREQELESSLRQKEFLLKEVNHRVRNNLQIIASMLRLREKAIDSAEARCALHEAHVRVQVLALVQKRLYDSEDLAEVDVKGLMGELIDLLIETHEGGCEIRVTERIAAIRLPTDRAISLALLTAELISNALKHAFTGCDRGTIEVDLSLSEERITLIVADNGSGIRQRQGGIGLQMATMLARQLKGDLSFTDDDGTRAVLTFGLTSTTVAPTEPVHEPA